jgi:hypothetical protein
MLLDASVNVLGFSHVEAPAIQFEHIYPSSLGNRLMCTLAHVRDHTFARRHRCLGERLLLLYRIRGHALACGRIVVACAGESAFPLKLSPPFERKLSVSLDSLDLSGRQRGRCSDCSTRHTV